MTRRNSRLIVAGMAAVLGCMTLSGGAIAQGEQAADQSVFQDDAELMQLNNAQVNQVEGQVQSAEQQAAIDNQRNQQYRLYAEKKVKELQGLKNKSASTNEQLAVLTQWLKADTLMRQRDMQTIRMLQERLARLEQTQGQVGTNLSADVNAIREAGQDAKDAQKFQQQMSMNYFNELQTEVGPASWYTPIGNGAYYSMGGMGFNGGQNLFGGY